MGMSFGSFASRSVATRVVATDGTGDFTDVQKAIDDLPSTGGVVYVKEGTYTITTKISVTGDNVSLFGAGRAAKISTTSDINILEVSGDFFSTADLYLFGAGSGKTNNTGLFLSQSKDSFVRNLWVENCGNQGIHLFNGSHRGIVTNCHVLNNFDNGILLTSISAGDNTDIIIANNISSGNTDTGIDISSADRVVCVGNISLSNDLGIDVGGDTTDAIITGNLSGSNTTSEITDSGTNTQIGHNIET